MVALLHHQSLRHSQSQLLKPLQLSPLACAGMQVQDEPSLACHSVRLQTVQCFIEGSNLKPWLENADTMPSDTEETKGHKPFHKIEPFGRLSQRLLAMLTLTLKLTLSLFNQPNKHLPPDLAADEEPYILTTPPTPSWQSHLPGACPRDDFAHANFILTATKPLPSSTDNTDCDTLTMTPVTVTLTLTLTLFLFQQPQSRCLIRQLTQTMTPSRYIYLNASPKNKRPRGLSLDIRLSRWFKASTG